MAKRVDLFTINVLGLTETIDSLSVLESELKAINSIVTKHKKTIQEFEQAQKAGVETTERMSDAYLDAKKVLPGLEDKQKSLVRQIQATDAIINKEIEDYKALIREKNKEAAATKKQSDEDKKLQQSLSIQVKSIQDLSTKTNALIAARKKLDITTEEGRSKFDALTREIAKNQNQLKEYDSQIGNFQRNVGNYSSAVSGLFNAWTKGAALIAGASKAIEYSIKIIGNETEGVEQAFARLNNPRALDMLRSATKGAVSDLSLMKAAVKADNFKIPMDALAKGLQFAQKQAKATGEDVDYLVNSFVMGIGRKSALILDNLGISSVELREKLRGIGTESATTGQIAAAVMEAVDERMNKFGDDTDIAKEKAGQLTATWQNLRDQATKRIASFLSPLAEEGKEALQWILKNAEAIWIFIKALGVLTLATYSYIVAGKLKLLLSKENRVATAAETLATYEQTVAQGKATASTHLLAAAKLLLTRNTKAATIAFKTFKVELLSNPAGIVLFTITALAGAVILLKNKTTELTKAQQSNLNITQKVDEEYGKSKAKIDVLIETLNNEKISLDKRNEALKELKDIIPGYNAEITKEGQIINNNTKAIDLYLVAFEKQIRLKAAQEELEQLYRDKRKQEKIYNEKQAKADSAKQSANTTVIGEPAYATASRGLMAGQLQSFADSAKKELSNTDEAIKEINSEIQKTSQEFSDIPVKTQDISKEVENTKKKIQELKQSISDLRNGKEQSSDIKLAIEEKTKELQDAQKALETLTGQKPSSEKSDNNTEENAANKRADVIKKNNETIIALQQESERLEIEAEVDSIEKKLKLQEQGDKKEINQLYKTLRDRRDAIEEAQKGANPEQWAELERQRIALFKEVADQEQNILNGAGEERRRLLKNQSLEELQSFEERLSLSKDYSQKDLELVRAVIDEKRKLQDQALTEGAQKELEKLQVAYQAEKDIINATISDQTKREKALVDLELANAQDRYAILKKEYELRLANGELGIEEADAIKKKLKELFDEIGVFAEEAKRTTPLAKMLGLDDENVELLTDKAIQLAQDISNTIANIELERNQQRLERETKRIDKAKEKDLSALEQRKKKGIMSEEAYERNKKAIDDKYKAEKEAAERKAFEKEKDIKRKQALMEMALGLVRIWSQVGINVVTGAILSGALVATTALNIAQINAQQFAEGGKALEKLPNGKIRYNPNIKTLSNGDNILATVRKGEVILNEEQQKRLGGDSVFRSIGVPGFASGGKVDMGPWYSAPIPESPERSAAKKIKQTLSDAEMIDYIDKKMDAKIKALKIYVTQTDIQDTDDTVKATVTQSDLL